MEYSDFYISTEKARISPIAVDAIYYVIADNHYHIQHASIPDTFVLVITLSGQGTIRLREKCIEIHSGDIIIFDASQSSFKYRCTNESWNFWWFEFRCTSPDFLNIPLSQLQYAPLKNIELSLCDEALNSLKLNNQKTASFLTASLICMLTEQKPETRLHNKNIELFQKADQYIRHNLSSVTVNTLSRHLNISERSTLEIFQALFGIPTVEYIQNTKMELARHQLTTSDITIQEISDYLGYADQSTFSKCFRKHFGIPPFQYRKQQRIPLGEGKLAAISKT